MKHRVILVCTLLLLAAVPSFALPLCQECNYVTHQCDDVTGAYERCRYDTLGNCYLDPWSRCSPTLTQSTVLADWKVVSVETTCLTPDSVAATAPAAAAEDPMPASRTTELK